MFDQLRARYGDRIFGFEHFSVSRSPEENVHTLLEALPDRENVFDMIGYSRGGLLLRTLAELPASAGPLARRFKLGRAVLVAVPNGGTPLATGDRWENTLGLVANIAEALPDNPWTMAADFVASGIVWLASHASGGFAGPCRDGRQQCDGEGAARRRGAGERDATRRSAPIIILMRRCGGDWWMPASTASSRAPTISSCRPTAPGRLRRSRATRAR